MQEIKNKLTLVEIEEASLLVAKGYEYQNKEGKTRYTYNEVYYSDDERIYRKHTSEKGEFYYNVDLLDVVVETFKTKEGKVVSKTYPLSEVPYLAPCADEAKEEVLKNFLEFKLHR